MRRKTIILTFCLALMAMSTTACTHALEVKNLDLYATSVHLVSIDPPAKVGVLPYTGEPDGLFYFNTLVDRLSNRPGIAKIQTDYIATKTNPFNPDVILSIAPTVTYRSSGWNFLINWPGFIIFTPAWNGYVYYADIMTEISIHDGSGNLISTTKIPISYDIREAEMDRTVWSTGLGWLLYGATSFVAGFYNVSVFDRDIIGTLENHVKDNYTTYISNQMQSKVQAAVETLRAQSSISQGNPADPPPPSTPSLTPGSTQPPPPTTTTPTPPPPSPSPPQ